MYNDNAETCHDDDTAETSHFDDAAGTCEGDDLDSEEQTPKMGAGTILLFVLFTIVGSLLCAMAAVFWLVGYWA